MSSKLTNASLQRPLSPLSVRVLMNKAQAAEIAHRLRELRSNSRETNRTIASYCGVAERTVAGWASPGNPMGMTFDHAIKVAELFEVDVDWLWRGREKGQTPDVIGSLSERLEWIEQALQVLLQTVAPDAVARLAGDVAQETPGSRSQPAQAQDANGKRARAAKRRAS